TLSLETPIVYVSGCLTIQLRPSTNGLKSTGSIGCCAWTVLASASADPITMTLRYTMGSARLFPECLPASLALTNLARNPPNKFMRQNAGLAGKVGSACTDTVHVAQF